MADQEGAATPKEEPESGTKIITQAVEATVNGIDKVINDKSKGSTRSKGRSRKKASKSKSGGKPTRRAKENSRGDSANHAGDSSSTSSSDDDDDDDDDSSSSESDTDSSLVKRKHKKSKSRRAERTKASRENRRKTSSRKILKNKSAYLKAANGDSTRDGVTDSSSSSSESDSDSSEDEKLTDNQESQQKGTAGGLSEAAQQQIKDLQLQISMLQQAMLPPTFTNSAQLGYVATPQHTFQPAPALSPPPGLFPVRGAQQMPVAPSTGIKSFAEHMATTNAAAQSSRPVVRRGQHNPDNAPISSPSGNKAQAQSQDKKHGSPSRPDFKRVDWVWDTTNYTYKLQDSVETSSNAQYDGYVFHVRRTFDPDGKYRKTTIDIKSKLLRESLQDVMGSPKGVSLVDETPKLDPNMLFLYLSDFRSYYKALKKVGPAGRSKKTLRKNQALLDKRRKHLKVLIKYLETDFGKVKSSLDPMLKNGLVTFDLLWALWKPGTLAYTTTYGNPDMPRVFKVEAAERHMSVNKGEFYYVEGKHFEFDGKRFGYGGVFQEVPEFKGARKITSLPCYPLSYCADEEGIRKKLIARGQKFVGLSGTSYKAYNGMAFMKRKKAIIRFNITNSRVMIDPATFRRINPNYYVSQLRSRDPGLPLQEEDSSDDDGLNHDDSDSSDDDGNRLATRAVRDPGGNLRFIHVVGNRVAEKPNKQALTALPQEAAANTDKAEDATGDDKDEETKNGVDDSKKEGDPTAAKAGSKVTDDSKDNAEDSLAVIKSQLTDMDYLLASPVVLGFSFSEKQWLEFSVENVLDIKWNDKAWESLVLEAETKRLIRALVESRKYNPATTIDDVIQGKGKGLVAVLHGPPGTGKTLTAEGISELLKCPLYMASAGELGTDSRFLEHELQKILDICHTWGAILLLDEADVFLEKRNMQDIHRNALVSIFLRQLEYFQGILFLTTNRVETFDEAFQSRIHVALRYDKLDHKAKRAIFKMFIDRVKAYGRMPIEEFSDSELSTLAKQDLNGREIKNVMGSAQDLALNKKEPLGLKHIRQVLDVHAKFGRDLKGGTGFEDAMRSYF